MRIARYFRPCLLGLATTGLTLLSACGEEAPALKLQPGGCGLLLTLRFSPLADDAGTLAWQGHLETSGANLSLQQSSELESDDTVSGAAAGENGPLSWKLATPIGDSDSLTARILPEASETDNVTEGEIEIRVVDDLHQQSLSYTYAQLKTGLQLHQPIDRAGWTHLYDLETRFVGGPCP